MSHPERPPHNLELVSRAMERLARIVAVKYPPVSDNAKWVMQMLEKELYVFDVIDPERKYVQNWAIDFQVQEDPMTHQPEGVVLIDPYRLSSVRDEVVDSELVRTVSLAVQYPGRGFSRPLRLAYNEAVEIQKMWLEVNRVQGTILDPRVYDRKLLLKSVMSPEVYYADFGYTHWKDALRTMKLADQNKKSAEEIDRERVIVDLAEDENAFILWRARMAPRQYHGRPMSEILEQRLEREPFEVLMVRNAEHAASNAVRERTE